MEIYYRNKNQKPEVGDIVKICGRCIDRCIYNVKRTYIDTKTHARIVCSKCIKTIDRDIEIGDEVCTDSLDMMFVQSAPEQLSICQFI